MNSFESKLFYYQTKNAQITVLEIRVMLPGHVVVETLEGLYVKVKGDTEV